MERRGAVIGLVIAIFIVLILLLYPSNLGNYTVPDTTIHFGHSIIAYFPPFLIGNTKRQAPQHFEKPKQPNQRHNAKNKISVFTGRGANKNQAIFKILDTKGPLAISDLQKILNKQKGLEITYYASLNKRVHALEKGGYLTVIQPATASQRGFKAVLYEASAKFYLAIFLNGNSREEILSKLTNAHALILLADLVDATTPNTEH
jgi:predicted Zn-ribbon and HTH transcriptional regulator